MDSQAEEETKLLREHLTALSDENKQLKAKLSQLAKDKQAADKKISQQSTRLNALNADLNEERQLGKALRKNQEKFQFKIAELDAKYAEREKEIVELKDQLRDLMFFIDAKEAIEKSENREEIAEGTVTVGEVPQTSKQRRRKKK